MEQSPYNYSFVMNFNVYKAVTKKNVAEVIKDVQRQVAKVNLIFTANEKNLKGL